MPTDQGFTITFKAGKADEDPVFVEVIKGVSNTDPDTLLRYIDLNPADV